MRWQTRRHLRSVFVESLWPAPVVAMILALAVSPVVMWVDQKTNYRLLNHTPDGARALLSAIAPAALTFIALILSTLLLSVQLAASQLSPRLIAGLLARPQVKICLAVFVFSYTYCAAVLGRIEPNHVPQLPMLVAVASTLITIGAGLYLIGFMATELRPVRMLARTAEQGRTIIARVYPHRLSEGGDRGGGIGPPLPGAPFVSIGNGARSGTLLEIDAHALVALAQRAGRVIELVPQLGDFVPHDDPLFRVYPDPSSGGGGGGAGGIRPDELYAAVALGPERTPEQDPLFAFRIVVDVASRALSPAVNDPTTAVLAIDQLHFLLRQVGLRHLDTNHFTDRDGKLRLMFRTPRWEDYVLIAVSEVRLFGGGSIQVARRLRAMLENLSASLPEERRPALAEQLRLLTESVRREFDDPADRVQADTGDLQGVGSCATANRSGTVPKGTLSAAPRAP